MDQKTIILLGITLLVIIAVIAGVGYFIQKDSSLVSSNGTSLNAIETEPSETLKSYSDPAGFSFNYPDNLSLTNNQTEESESYADLKLTAAGIDGSLNLKIVDTKLKTNQAWAESVDETVVTKEVNLGNLKALQIESSDKLTLGAIDQGVLFTIEANFGSKKDFWLEVYEKVIADFTFVVDTEDTATAPATSGSDVSFEGEEVVE